MVHRERGQQKQQSRRKKKIQEIENKSLPKAALMNEIQILLNKDRDEGEKESVGVKSTKSLMDDINDDATISMVPALNTNISNSSGNKNNSVEENIKKASSQESTLLVSSSPSSSGNNFDSRVKSANSSISARAPTPSFKPNTNTYSPKPNTNQQRGIKISQQNHDNDNEHDNPWTPDRIAFAKTCTLFQQNDLPAFKQKSQTFEPPANSWSNCPGSNLKVRSGPNYSKNKIKNPSGESLYHPVALRCYKSSCITPCISKSLPFPTECLSGMEEFDRHATNGNNNIKDTGRWWNRQGNEDIPEVLVIRFVLPYESPSMFGGGGGGKSGTVFNSDELVIYLRPTHRFIEEMNSTDNQERHQHNNAAVSPLNVENDSNTIRPATRLFKRWCILSTQDAAFRSRFKCMAKVRDFETRHSNLSYLKQYNGRPVIITESGRVMKGTTCGGVRFLEMRCNLHIWSFFARKGLSTILPHFANMRLDLGFTIEATKDDEMPECTMGSLCMNFINEKLFPVIPYSVQQPLAT